MLGPTTTRQTNFFETTREYSPADCTKSEKMATAGGHNEGNSCVALRLPLEGDRHGVPVVVHASTVFEHEMKDQSACVRKAVRKRPYCCSGGSKLMIVIRKDGGHHFRHYTKVEVDKTESGVPSAGNFGGCNCSEEHLIAQRLLVENIHRIEVQTWNVCKKHVAATWSNERACASLEENATYNGRRVRYDVVARDRVTDARLKVFEVRHTHKTDPNNRPTGSVEVDASHVIAQCGKSVDGQYPIVLHNLFVDDRSCSVCEAEELARMEMERLRNEQRRVARAEEERLHVLAEKERLHVLAEKERLHVLAEKKRLARMQRERLRNEQQEASKAEQDRAARAEEERLHVLAEKERVRVERLVPSVTISPTVGFSVRIGDGSAEHCKEWVTVQEEIDAARSERMERARTTQVAGKKRGRLRRKSK